MSPPRRHVGLTAREREVLRLRASGLTVKAAAARLGVSPQTTKNISLMACRKLGVIGLVEAMNALGWVALPDDPREVS